MPTASLTDMLRGATDVDHLTLTREDMRRDVATLANAPLDDVRDDADLIALGLDSMGVMTLASLWHRKGTDLKFAELIACRTLAGWWALASSRVGTAARNGRAHVSIDETAPFDLDTMQHAYWIGRDAGQSLGLGCHFYFEFDGDGIDPDRLGRAVRAVIARHGMLRARFSSDGRQQIETSGAWTGPYVHDLRDAAPDVVALALDERRVEQSHRSLDVERGEVFDIQLSLLPGARSRLHVNIDMLVADALSFRILMDEVARFYADPELRLPALGYSFPRYLADKAARGSEERDRGRAYWAERLHELPGPPQLPLAGGVAGTLRSGRRDHWMPPSERDVLAARGRSYGITLPMALATAFAEVLAAWSAEPRFVLNVPMFGREALHPEVSQIVGDFTTSVVLAFDGSARASFVDRARALQSRFSADVAHNAYSGVDVFRDRRRLHADAADAAASVVFTSVIGIGDLFGDNVRRQFGRLAWMISQTAQVWLDHQVVELDEGLLLNWDAVETRFPPGVLDAMFAAYRRLVSWLLDPATDWHDVVPDLMPPDQRAVRAKLPGVPVRLSNRCLHDAFFGRAAAAPERVALAWGDDGQMTYGVLAARARRLASYLVGRGVRPGEPVAVTVARGPAQIEAVLAILAAGGVYVPVGIDQPLRRRARIYEQARVRFVLTGATAASLEWPPSVEPIAIDAIDAIDDRAAAECSLVGVAPSSLAYIVFTSGSTGDPKGVMVTHAAAMNTIDDINERGDVRDSDRVLAVSALDFDLSVYDIFGLLSTGGALVLVQEHERREAGRWLELVSRHSVTLWNSVPALLQMLLDAANDVPVAAPIRLALLSGDWVPVDVGARVGRLLPGCRVIALGGATEGAIWSNAFEVTTVPPSWRSIPYGYPLRNQQYRVVDAHGRDCPDWVCGELWIGGAGVAEGYCGDPERTARQFVDHGGGRWYRTGDLGRYWPNGCLEFLGRVDHQVKVRGHRIELGEVQAALEEHPDVAHAVAVTIGAGSPRLAAAVVPTGGSLDASALQAFLATRLPAYMVPEHIATLDALPLGGTGKIDRKEIRRLIEATARSSARREAPVGEIEELVAAEWSALLQVPSVGRDESFFALGGDSLIATRLMARLRARGMAGAELRHLFASPSLKDFAASLSLGAAAPPPSPLVTRPEARFDPFPPTDVQLAYWRGRSAEFTLGGVGSHWYWEFDGTAVDVSRLEWALNRLVERHDMLRAVFDVDGMQRVMPRVPAYRIHAERPSEADETRALDELRERMSHRVPDPSTWPLFEVQAVHHGGDRCRLGFSFDYIVLDALSITIVFSELAELYEHPDASLPALGVTFRDYLLGSERSSGEVAAAEEYWGVRRTTLPAGPQLPLATDPSAIASPRFVRREARLTADQWRALTAHARQHNLTPAAVLATAYGEVLSAWSGGDPLTMVFTMFDRREVHPDINRVVGDFTSLLLVAYEPPASGGWADAAQCVQREIWLGLEHRAVSALSTLREMGRASGRAANVPVVFTSTLGVADDIVELSLPFGAYIGGLSQTPQVWLDNQVVEYKGELLINWDAVEALFPAGVLDEMFGAYLRLLGWLSASPRWDGAAPASMPVSQQETRARRNETARPRSGRLLHEAFFETATRTPEALAVVCGTERMSYGELADRALRVAASLDARGVRPGDAVAITLPKGCDQIAAVLGTLAAGAAYVPIGPEQPPARRQRICANAGVRVVLDDLAQAGETDPSPGPRPLPEDSLAYVIYTSGSTGEPKGVEITHAAAMNTVDDINERFGVTSADRVLAVSALDFDLSVYDIFGMLSAGGAVVVPTPENRLEPPHWWEQLQAWGVTIWNSVPALLEMLLMQAREGPRAESLRVALVSGDWVPLDLHRRLTVDHPQCRLVALGGATEAAIWSNAFEVTEVPRGWRSIPYGYPLRNQQFRVVDARGRDCPDWVAGELWIGGAGVALGYRGDEARTARQFVEAGGTRWYRTGDRGRYWPGGAIEFLGRIDQQVKVGGYRVELGEIESALKSHAAVVQAVAFRVGTGTRGLAAAVVFRDESGPDVDELRAHLARELMPYMVPDRILPVSALPLTANGKVARQFLEQLATAEDGAADEAPDGETERAIATAWATVLGGTAVSRRANFFMLGGDSVSAMRAVDALRVRFGVTLTLREFLAGPTVAEIAAVIGARAVPVDLSAMDEGSI